MVPFMHTFNLKPLSYFAVASPEYGHDFDITHLLRGSLDWRFKTNKHVFFAYCSRRHFADLNNAIKDAKHRSVGDNSAYVIGLACAVSDVMSIVKTGKFSGHILYALNVTTLEQVELPSRGTIRENRI